MGRPHRPVGVRRPVRRRGARRRLRRRGRVAGHRAQLCPRRRGRRGRAVARARAWVARRLGTGFRPPGAGRRRDRAGPARTAHQPDERRQVRPGRALLGRQHRLGEDRRRGVAVPARPDRPGPRRADGRAARRHDLERAGVDPRRRDDVLHRHPDGSRRPLRRARRRRPHRPHARGRSGGRRPGRHVHRRRRLPLGGALGRECRAPLRPHRRTARRRRRRRAAGVELLLRRSPRHDAVHHHLARGHERRAYAASPEESLFYRGLNEGRIMGQRCPTCEKVYIPPRSACPADGTPTAEEIELSRPAP